LVDPALAHRGGFFRQRTPAPDKPLPNADQSAGRIKHEGDEDHAEIEQPVRTPDRKQFAEQTKTARDAGPSMLCMPPITTIASSSPENGTETASADTR